MMMMMEGEIKNLNEKEKGFYIDLLSIISWVIFGNILFIFRSITFYF